ncbi:MAG TPA: LysE family translocator [Thermoleophilaceae bacterium]
MARALIAFAPVAALLSLAPGPATALVVRNAARGGRRHALFTTVGSSLGVFAWGAFAALGIAAVVAASAELFTVLKLVGALFLVYLGVQSLRGKGASPVARRPRAETRSAFREGLATAIANPKLAAFFVALFPQFVPRGAPVLPSALLMAATIVVIDFAWYSSLAFLVARARRAFVEGPWLRRFERLTGVVLVGLGVRLALERR